MNTHPYKVVADFEQALCDYTGAPKAVTVTSCTMALLLAAKLFPWRVVRVPKRTYVSVPMSVRHAGHDVLFDDIDWLGFYQLAPLPVFDSARWFSKGMFEHIASQFPHLPHIAICVSFHATKTLGLEQGGAILHNFPNSTDVRLRRLRFDGRTVGLAVKDDNITEIGYHAYISPSVAAMGLLKLSVLPAINPPLPNDDYPDLSKYNIF